MRLSTTDVYALHALGYLGTRERDELVSGDDISAATGIARPYLMRLLANLVAAGIVLSRKGPAGGYCLARPAAAINLRDVMRAIDGPIAPLSCVSLNWYRPCPMEGLCTAQSSVYQRMRDAILAVLAEVSVADLAKDVGNGVDYRHCVTHVLAPN